MFSQKGKFFIERRLMSTGESKNWESVFKIETDCNHKICTGASIIAQGDWILSRDINLRLMAYLASL
jgi:hypothetical protein